MNIRCPHCQTVFRVNPERIPPSGVRARCARCGDSFMVRPPAQGEAPAAAAPPAMPAPMAPSAPAPTPPRPTPPAQPASFGTSREERQPAAAASPAATATRVPFGKTDPNKRAERIARALVSDIVAYHPERREKSLAAGTLRTEFREEIMKSWEEYVAQVGTPMAKSTPYFRDALNAILASGEHVF